MSISSLINPTTGKLYDEIVPQGGGINLAKGQIITATATQEVAFPIAPPADGSVLSYDSTEPTGLKYIAVPAGIPLDYQQLISANNGNNPAIVPAPANNGYVLTADTDPANATGLAWKAVGGSGTLNAIAPLIDEEVANVSTISINFSASVGEIPYGNGTAKTGALTNTPVAGQILGVSGGVPAWINAGGSGTITALAPLTEFADGNASKVAVNFTGKGDLIVGGGVQVGGEPVAGVILPAGANDMVLTCNSATASGLEWKASGGGSSATIFRDSEDNSAGHIATITKPITANDTCVIVADRTYHNFNTQIKNTPSTAGTPVPATTQAGIDFLVFQIPFDMTLTGFSGTIYLENNTIAPSQDPNTGFMNLNNQDQSQTLLGSDEMDWLNAGNFNVSFTATGSIFLASGTDVVFNFGVDNLTGDTCNAIDTGGGVYSGNLTITGVEYANIPVSFQIATGGKFRPSGDLTGKLIATCDNFSSQTFVASADLNDWIVSGGVNAGVAFP